MLDEMRLSIHELMFIMVISVVLVYFTGVLLMVGEVIVHHYLAHHLCTLA